jgi:hypothetical protein
VSIVTNGWVARRAQAAAKSAVVVIRFITCALAFVGEGVESLAGPQSDKLLKRS